MWLVNPPFDRQALTLEEYAYDCKLLSVVFHQLLNSHLSEVIATY